MGLNPMKTDVDTCLKEIADWYIKNRRTITEPELKTILLKHCESEAEVQKFIEFLETEPGQMRFKTLLREREETKERIEELEAKAYFEEGLSEAEERELAELIAKLETEPREAAKSPERDFWLGIAGAERKFPLGQIVMTRGVNDLVATNTEFAKFVTGSLRRHASGDWGDLPEEDKRENEYALDKYLRLFSAYEKPPLPKIWIITEADRSVTTMLFPEEY